MTERGRRTGIRDRSKPNAPRIALAARKIATEPGHGLARVLSKRGFCSRSQGEALVTAGRVRVDGRIQRDPEHRTAAGAAIEVDDTAIAPATPVYLMLNKPRGIVVSASDERGRDTVYDLLADPSLPWLGPVGRLDKASEGLLLLSNDTEWAAGITEPDVHLAKTYHVQVGGLPADALTPTAAMVDGIDVGDERLSAKSATLLRRGDKNAWLEIVLDEGRNRQIRRLLTALGFEVLRLVRVAIGDLALGDLSKGAWRRLTAEEVAQLRPSMPPGPDPGAGNPDRKHGRKGPQPLP